MQSENIEHFNIMTELETILRDQQQEILRTDYKQLVSRKEEEDFDLNSDLAQIVIGVRRSGKSTICKKVLKESGVNFAYVNFDDEYLASLPAERLNDIIHALYLIYGKFSYLFMDEIQNADKWPLFVNRLLRQGYHLIITGSNANLLSGELITHLTGRYNEIRLFPFSYAEYCQLKDVDVTNYTTEAIALRKRALEKYLEEGGLPELHKLKNPNKYVRSLLDTIIMKDICRRYNVRYRKTLSQLANALLDRFCQEFSYHEVQKEFDFKSAHTAKNYINYLSNAYLLRVIPKFSFKSIEKQNGQKNYAVDVAFVSNHENVLQSQNLGWRLENAVAIELMRRLEYESEEIFYLNEHKQFEVDFVVVDRGKAKELIQVTYDFDNPSTKLFNREVNGLIKGSKYTHCDNLTLIMMHGPTGDIQKDGKNIHCVLATDWLLGNKGIS